MSYQSGTYRGPLDDRTFTEAKRIARKHRATFHSMGRLVLVHHFETWWATLGHMMKPCAMQLLRGHPCMQL